MSTIYVSMLLNKWFLVKPGKVVVIGQRIIPMARIWSCDLWINSFKLSNIPIEHVLKLLPTY